MGFLSQLDWHPGLLDPTGKRQDKPRKTGRTMIIDKGLGIHAFEDLLETAAPYIDMIKIGFGTSVLYPRSVLAKKIELAEKKGICIFPGGTFLEIAVHRQVVDSFFDMVVSLNFNSIEISDGTIDMTRQLRNEFIQRSIENGLTVFTEYGKKSGAELDFEQLIDTVHQDLEQGAELVTVEARESGTGVGLFDEQGKCNEEDIYRIAGQFPDNGKHILMWETPLKSQQTQFIQTLGADVNLGNIAPQDILSVEALRRGLRSDTFASLL